MIPIMLFVVGLGFLFRAGTSKQTPPSNNIPTLTSGNAIDLTPHLTEFTSLVRQGHRPNQWLITEAINEAYNIGNLRLAFAIGDNFSPAPRRASRSIERSKSRDQIPETIEIAKEDQKPVEEELAKNSDFLVERTTSPLEGIGNDEWRLFVTASKIESPEFDSESSIGMFRQNKKRLAKLGMAEAKDPLAQYDAFEKEVAALMEEGKSIMKEHVGMPIDIDGQMIPVMRSGLVAVMRMAGTKNTEKWLSSADERKKFPHTTESFKKSNDCF